MLLRIVLTVKVIVFDSCFLAEIVHGIYSAQYYNNSYVLGDRVGMGMVYNIASCVESLFEFKAFHT